MWKASKKKQYYQRKQDAEVPGTTTRKSDALDLHMYTVYPSNAECFHL